MRPSFHRALPRSAIRAGLDKNMTTPVAAAMMNPRRDRGRRWLAAVVTRSTCLPSPSSRRLKASAGPMRRAIPMMWTLSSIGYR